MIVILDFDLADLHIEFNSCSQRFTMIPSLADTKGEIGRQGIGYSRHFFRLRLPARLF
jgi:hypothetical protein